MKVKHYTLEHSKLELYWVDSSFEINLLTNANKVTPLGAIICGRVVSAMTILVLLFKNRKIISNNSSLELIMSGRHGCTHLQVIINSFGEMYYNSDSLRNFYNDTNGKQSMNVSSFMCGEQSDPLRIELYEHRGGIKSNLIYNKCSKEHLVSNSGNISDEFTQIMQTFGIMKTALSLGVEYSFEDFSIEGSGGFFYLSNVEDRKMIVDLTKNINTLEPIKDLFKNNNFNQNKIERQLIFDYEVGELQEEYFSFNFNSFTKPIYDKQKLLNAFKENGVSPNYAQIVNVDYSNSYQKLVENTNKSRSVIIKREKTNCGVVGVYEESGVIRTSVFILNVELSDKLTIVNDCDEDFYNSCKNILHLLNDEVNIRVSLNNLKLTLAGSSLSCSIFYVIYCKIHKIVPNFNWMFSGNLDQYGNVKYVNSLIYKVKCAIKNSYSVFYTSVENKLELESKLLMQEKERIKIIYLENIFDFVKTLSKKEQ